MTSDHDESRSGVAGDVVPEMNTLPLLSRATDDGVTLVMPPAGRLRVDSSPLSSLTARYTATSPL